MKSMGKPPALCWLEPGDRPEEMSYSLEASWLLYHHCKSDGAALKSSGKMLDSCGASTDPNQRGSRLIYEGCAPKTGTEDRGWHWQVPVLTALAVLPGS